MSEQLQMILAELRERLTDLYGDRLDRLILYGSQARGDAEPDSDIDVLVVLKGDVNPWKEVLRSEEVTGGVSQRYDVFIAPMFVGSDDFRKGDRSLLVNVRREGVRL